MNHYSLVAIIYNPKSTGPGSKMAHDLAKNLRKTSLKSKVKIIPTEHAGHAETLAYECSLQSDKPLILSSSGDGGYNEVINGAMKAISNGAHPTTGLLPAGNANDHYHNLHERALEDMIVSGKTHCIDLLRLTAQEPEPWQRYAHSYIGFGLTPQVGAELNKTDLNAFNELVIAAKAFYDLKSIKIMRRGEIKQYDSLIFSNVQKMSKVLNLSDTSAMHDGMFEITEFPHHTKVKLLMTLFKAATKGLSVTKQSSKYTFQSLDKLAVQLDGEIAYIAAHSKVKIDIVPRILRCVV